jgi:hypothetical protein
MATGNQKKRPIHSTDSDPCKPAKKTKFHSANCLVNLSLHIGLKWDQHLRRVVPEKEQVGLLWSDLAPFIERPKHRSGLADVTYMPPATFSFENLGDILSYEVCQFFSTIFPAFLCCDLFFIDDLLSMVMT